MTPAAAPPDAQGVPVEEHLRGVRGSGRKILVTYVTGGFGSGWLNSLQAMVASGADLVEIGIPFSDPMMDGPTIQEASTKALAEGATPGAILDSLRRLDVPVPLAVAMTLAQPWCSVPATSASPKCSSTPVSEGRSSRTSRWKSPRIGRGRLRRPASRRCPAGGPSHPRAGRLAELCRRSHGFVYGVNLMGVTGERTTMAVSAGVLAKRLKAVTDKPVVMGFGISTPEQRT